MLLAIMRFFYPQAFLDFTKGSGADKFISNRTRGSFLTHPLQLSLLAIQFLIVSLFIYIIFCKLTGASIAYNREVYIKILTAFTIFEIVKNVLDQLISRLLDVSNKMLPFLYKRLNIKNILALSMLFFCFLIVYNSSVPLSVIYTIITAIVIFYIGSQIWTLRKYSNEIIKFPFYFILYFCTLEIAPYFVLYKHLTM